MGAGLDDDGRKELRSGQYSDWGRRVSRTGLWWDGFMPVPEWLPAAYVFWSPACSMYRSQGQDADRMTLPHQQATELGHSVPVTKRDPPLHPGPWMAIRSAPLREPRCIPEA